MIAKFVKMFIWLIFIPHGIGLFVEACRALSITEEEVNAIDEDMIRRWEIAKNPFVQRKRQLEREGVIPYMEIPGEADFDEEEKVETKISKIFPRFKRFFSPGYNLMVGYIMMWALFQIFTVPCIIMGHHLDSVSILFSLMCIILTICGMVGFFRVTLEWKWKEFIQEKREWLKQKVWDKRRIIVLAISWGIFALLLLFQLYKSYTLAYADGDDAYYIPISTAANLGGGMYEISPYTGAPTDFDIRHGLAPFPMWVSFIADKMGVNTAVAAHTWIPLVLIPLTYIIYYYIGKELLLERKHYISVFMNFVALLQIFGNYSIYPASTFLLTRTRQGKAALGNIIIPFLIYLLIMLVKDADRKNGYGSFSCIFKLFMLSFAASLCSTMSGFLIMFLAGTVFLWIYVRYQSWKLILQYMVAFLPSIAYAIIYFVGDYIFLI
ncbi:MAG: hypothetical protein IKL06_01955 [Lachnospiraceae bacterium]|nr:hypothetical protein [Lachnospiraceae bacterium]